MYRFPFLLILLSTFSFVGASQNLVQEFIIDADQDPALGGFGLSFSGDGSKIAVSSPKALPPNFPQTGKVQIFDISGVTINQVGQDIFGTEGGAEFGYNIDLNYDGSIVAIGIPEAGGSFFFGGSVKVYRLNGNSEWEQMGQAIDGESVSEFTGKNIQLSADGLTLITGSGFHDGTEQNMGRVRVFEFTQDQWILKGQSFTGETTEASVGQAVNISDDGNSIAFSSPGFDHAGSNNTGAVRFYSYDGNEWVSSFDPIFGEGSEQFLGRYLSMSNDRTHLAVSGDDENNGYSYINVYELSGVTWQKVGGSIVDEQPDDNIGRWFQLNELGNSLYIGLSRVDTPLGTDVGELRIYDLVAGDWVKRATSIFGQSQSELFGANVTQDLTSGLIAVSATRYENAEGGEGQVRFYRESFQLPTEFISLNVEQLIDKRLAKISWSAFVVEESFKQFDIEASVDEEWVTLSTLPKSEILLDQLMFSKEVDMTAFSKTLVPIRIKAIDLDESYVYSDVVLYQASKEKIVMYPNPIVGDKAYITISETDREYKLKVQSLDGAILQSLTINGGSSPIDVSGLRPGLYILSLTAAATREIDRYVFVKR